MSCLLMAALLLVACTGDEPAPLPASPTPVATPELLSAADVPPYEGLTRQVSGLFTEPRETQADVYRSVGPIPPSPFGEWDGASVVLYDLEAGRAVLDLGEGSIGFVPFSPDGTKFVWISGPFSGLSSRSAPDNEIWVLNLETMERRSYGQGQQASFHDDSTLRVTRGLSSRPGTTYLDIVSGDPVTVEQPPFEFTRMIAQWADGTRVERLLEDGDTVSARQAHYLVIPADGSPALQFDAQWIFQKDGGELWVMAGSEDTTTNLFVVDVQSGAATFVATIFGSRYGARFGFVADDDDAPYGRFAWVDYECDPELGHTRIYDPRNETITELDRALPLVIGTDAPVPSGLLLGQFTRLLAILDLDTLEYRDVMPGTIGPARSSDRRWAVNAPSIFESAEAARCEGA